jgi:hypothetical protein
VDFTPEQLPDTYTVEVDGKPLPLRDVPFVKEAKDLGGLIKMGYDAHREVGARVRLPGKEAAPEERNAFLGKLYENGLLQAPPKSPEEYGITKPESLPDGLTWSDESAKKLGTVLHKHGIPKAAVPELLALHQEMLSMAQTSLKTSEEEGVAALRKEFGDKYDDAAAAAGRLAGAIFKTPEELAFYENMGLANHPGFLGVLMRLAPLAQQDSSFLVGTRKGGEMSGDDVRSEVAKIMSDKSHPMYEGYHRNDPKVSRHIEELYVKAYGNGKVEIT